MASSRSATYITDLIAQDRAGRRTDKRAELYGQRCRTFYESTLALYQDPYPLDGDAEVLLVKVLRDYAYYWGVLSQIFFRQRLTDLQALGGPKGELQHCQRLNVQTLLRNWSTASARQPGGDARPGRGAVVRRAQP